MRSSSIKSVFVALSIAVTLVSAVPTASAAPAQGSRKEQPTRGRDEVSQKDRFAGVRQFINRALRRIGIEGGLTVPTPKQEE